MEIRLLNKRELRRNDWNTAQLNYSNFLSMRPNLIEILEDTLNELGVEKRTIKLDYSVESLDWLNKILPKFIKSRDLTPEEIKLTLDSMPKEHWVIIEKLIIFTPESEYLLNLVGLFIGELLILQNPSYYWALDKAKRSATYKQPILWGSGIVPYLPMQIMNVVGSKIILNHIEDPELVVIHKKMVLMLDGIYNYDKSALE